MPSKTVSLKSFDPAPHLALDVRVLGRVEPGGRVALKTPLPPGSALAILWRPRLLREWPAFSVAPVRSAGEGFADVGSAPEGAYVVGFCPAPAQDS